MTRTAAGLVLAVALASTVAVPPASALCVKWGGLLGPGRPEGVCPPLDCPVWCDTVDIVLPR